MRTRPTILFYSPDGCPVPTLVRHWASANEFPLLVFSRPEEVEAIVLRDPRFLFVDADRAGTRGVDLAHAQSDAFTAIVRRCFRPAILQRSSWFSAGTDEVITGLFSPAEQRSRLDAMLVRTERDVSVHPSTRLPGTTEIEREIRRQLEQEGEFAVCYADLDHFKEFNDRYSYYDGDRVIYLLSRILHDVVKGMLNTRGFVDTSVATTSSSWSHRRRSAASAARLFRCSDTLIPLQYNDQDRRAGYFFGKDQRGQLHRVPHDRIDRNRDQP